MEIVAFAFRGNISSEVLKKLNFEEKYLINSNEKAIIKLVSELIAKRPDYILGLGMYSGRDKDKLRIETHYSRGGYKHPINYFFTPGKSAKLASGLGNSYCNLISLKVMEAIGKKQVPSKYTFIHIPKTFPLNAAVLEIETMLVALSRES